MLTEDQKLYSWGRGLYGVLGNGSNSHELLPTLNEDVEAILEEDPENKIVRIDSADEYTVMQIADKLIGLIHPESENKEKYIGSDENWEKAEKAILNATIEKGLDYVVETGEAAFYGPKLDFMVKDALGRSWQLGTIQVDYNLPERFKLEYKGSDNEMHRPVMIHRAPFGSMERFIAILLEHTGGNFPLWLMPEQVIILSISEKYEKYARKVLNLLENNEIRALVDNRNETIGKKIREAEMQKYPYMIIIGENEESENKISVRQHGGEDLGLISIETFSEVIKSEISKTLKAF